MFYKTRILCSNWVITSTFFIVITDASIIIKKVGKTRF
jgi:hypothetical protein